MSIHPHTLASAAIATPDEADRLDARLATLLVGATRWRLALGDALERLGRLGGPRVLGFSSMGAYAAERCGYSGRWVEEARGLVRRLADLPRLRRALTDGIVTWSVGQLVARHATPETEDALLAEAATSTLRALRRRLEPARPDDDTAPARRTVETVVTIEEAWGFERARMLVEAVTGERATDAVVEHMLAETLTSLLPVGGGPDALRGIDRAADAARLRAERMRVDAEVRDALDAAFEGGLAPRAAAGGGAVTSDDGADLGDLDAAALDRRIAAIAGELRGRDLEIGRVAWAMHDAQAWRALGYRSFDHLVRERLGMSRSAMAGKLALARRCAALPALGAALEAGRIGLASASLVGRVATAETVHGWVERAAERTVKHLREEVEVVGLLARVEGAAVGPPPDEPTVEAVRDVERAVLSGAVQMSVGDPQSRGWVGTVPLRVTVAADLADLWMAVRDLYSRSGNRPDATLASDNCGGFARRSSFVAALSDSILRYWGPPDAHEGRPFESVYARDRYRCESPACDRRDVGAHHIVFRARGGSDAPENLVTLCGRCHLDGVHAGHLRVTGRAPDALAWRVGPALAVDGRRLRAAA